MTGTIVFIGSMRPKKSRRDPLAKIVHNIANAIRFKHHAALLDPVDDMALCLAMPQFAASVAKAERESPYRKPVPPEDEETMRRAMDLMASLPFDPNDPRLLRLRELVAKKLPGKLRAKYLAGELTW